MECPECGVEAAAASLLSHRQSQHRVGSGWGGGGQHPPPHTHTIQEGPDLPVILPKTLVAAPIPGSGCLGGASSRTNLWIHFAHRHVQDTTGILEEGNRPFPRCPQCDMIVPKRPLTASTLQLNSADGEWRGSGVAWRRRRHGRGRRGH